MRSFDSPKDVARAFEQVRKKSWKSATSTERRDFLMLLQGTPAAYAESRQITAPEIAADLWVWDWVKKPMDLGDINEGGAPFRQHYFDGGLKLPPAGEVNGWYFVPDYIGMEFFNAARARKNGCLTYVNTRIRGNVVDDGVDLLNSFLRTIGISVAAVKQRQYFIVDHQQETFTNDRIGPLFRTILLPYGASLDPLVFEDFTALAATDWIRVMMEGRWYFSPRFMEEHTLADD